MSRDFGRFATSIGGALIKSHPLGAAVTIAGGLLFAPKSQSQQSGGNGRIPDYQHLLEETSAYGVPIMEFFGSMQTTGNIIDCRYVGGVAAGIEEVISSLGGGHQFTGRHSSDSGGSQDTSTYTYFLTAAYAFGRSPNNQPLYIDKLMGEDSAGTHTLYDRAGASNRAKGYALTPVYDANGVQVGETGPGLHMWHGLESQPVDSILESFHGAGNVPAYRGVAYIVFDRFRLRYGYGKVWAIVRNAVTGKSDMVNLLCQRAGIPARRISLSQLQGTVDGMAISPGPTRQYVENICTLGLCHLAPIDGLIVDRNRANPLYQSIAAKWLGAHVASGGEDANSRPDPIKVTRVEPKTLPSEIRIPFQDTNLRYNQNEASYVIEAALYKNVVSVDLGPLAGNLTDMSRLAAVLGDEIWMANRTFDFSLMPACLRLAPGDVAYLVDNTGSADGVVQVLVTEQEITPDGILICKGTEYDGGVYGQFVAPDQNILPPATITLYDPPNYMVLQAPALNDTMAASPGVLVAACSPTGWSGAQLQSAVLGNHDIPKQATMGRLLTAYSYALNSESTIDYGTTIRVRLLNGTLVAATSESVIISTQANAILLQHPTSGLVGVLQFVNCAQVNSTDYDLSGLLPARKGTDYITSFPIGAGVVAVTDENGTADNAPQWLALGVAAIGKTAAYTVVPGGPAAADSATSTALIYGGSVKPLLPVFVRGDRSVAGQITVSWNARTRYETGNNPSMTRISDNEFQVTFSAGGTSPVLIVRNSNTIIVTDAQLANWFGAVPGVLFVSVVATNGFVGGGFVMPYQQLY